MRSVLNLTLCGATLLLVASCASSNVLTVPAKGCSTLAAPILDRDTPHAQLGSMPDGTAPADPANGDLALAWQLYGVAETGQLNQANRDKRDGLAIIRACEERDAAAARRINAPAWQFWR